MSLLGLFAKEAVCRPRCYLKQTCANCFKLSIVTTVEM